MNFFRDFGANVLLEKNTLKISKCLLSDNYTGEQGPGPMFLSYKSYQICKKLCPAEFLCNLELLEPTYIYLKKAKNAIFYKNGHF